MHPPPLVDPQTGELFRRRLAWGLLGLQQPQQDLPLALQAFVHRWTSSRLPPGAAGWQAQLLDTWRSQPRALRDVALDPVLETLIGSLAVAEDLSLNDYFKPALFDLARYQAAAIEEVKPVLRLAWQQISLGMQRLRPGLGTYSHEAAGVLAKILQALQHLNDYFQTQELASLQEAGWRWSEALQEFDRLACLMLTGMQPVSSPLLWGVLFRRFSQADPTPLGAWFAGWAMDLAHVLAPYLGSLGEERYAAFGEGVERFARALLSWQKLTPGWEDEVMTEWGTWLRTLPTPAPYPSRPTGFRWIAPEGQPAAADMAGGLWRRWVRGSASARAMLEKNWHLAQLVTGLAEPALAQAAVPFPEKQQVARAADWLREGNREAAAEWLADWEDLALGRS